MTILGLTAVAHRAIVADGATAPQANWPVVRVIWGRAVGSTYQAFTQSTASLSIDCGSWNHHYKSTFARPLDCPSCRGPLELSQATLESPDRIVGDCSKCRLHLVLDIGVDGRLTPSDDKVFSAPVSDPRETKELR